MAMVDEEVDQELLDILVRASKSDPNDRSSPFGITGVGRSSNAGSSGNGSDDLMPDMSYDLSDDIVGDMSLDDSLFNPLAGMRPSSATFDQQHSGGGGKGASRSSSSSRSSHHQRGIGGGGGGSGDLPMSAVFGETASSQSSGGNGSMASSSSHQYQRYGGGGGGNSFSSSSGRGGGGYGSHQSYSRRPYSSSQHQHMRGGGGGGGGNHHQSVDVARFFADDDSLIDGPPVGGGGNFRRSSESGLPSFAPAAPDFAQPLTFGTSNLSAIPSPRSSMSAMPGDSGGRNVYSSQQRRGGGGGRRPSNPSLNSGGNKYSSHTQQQQQQQQQRSSHFASSQHHGGGMRRSPSGGQEFTQMSHMGARGVGSSDSGFSQPVGRSGFGSGGNRGGGGGGNMSRSNSGNNFVKEVSMPSAVPGSDEFSGSGSHSGQQSGYKRSLSQLSSGTSTSQQPPLTRHHSSQNQLSRLGGGGGAYNQQDSDQRSQQPEYHQFSRTSTRGQYSGSSNPNADSQHPHVRNLHQGYPPTNVSSGGANTSGHHSSSSSSSMTLAEQAARAGGSSAASSLFPTSSSSSGSPSKPPNVTSPAAGAPLAESSFTIPQLVGSFPPVSPLPDGLSTGSGSSSSASASNRLAAGTPSGPPASSRGRRRGGRNYKNQTREQILARKAELARQSRRRKKIKYQDLEDKVKMLGATVEDLQRKLAQKTARNQALEAELQHHQMLQQQIKQEQKLKRMKQNGKLANGDPAASGGGAGGSAAGGDPNTNMDDEDSDSDDVIDAMATTVSVSAALEQEEKLRRECQERIRMRLKELSKQYDELAKECEIKPETKQYKSIGELMEAASKISSNECNDENSGASQANDASCSSSSISGQPMSGEHNSSDEPNNAGVLKSELERDSNSPSSENDAKMIKAEDADGDDGSSSSGEPSSRSEDAVKDDTNESSAAAVVASTDSGENADGVEASAAAATGSPQPAAAPMKNFQTLEMKRLEKEIIELLGQFTTNARGHQLRLDSYLDRLTSCIRPNVQSRFVLWGLDQNNEYYDAPNGLWMSLMTNCLSLSPEQIAKLHSRRSVILSQRNSYGETSKMVEQLGHKARAQIANLHALLDEIRKILTPVQLAKFIVWVEDNKWCMEMLTQNAR